MYTTITDVYRAYSGLFGSEQPLWTRDELQDWLQANVGTRYEAMTDDDIAAAYDASIAALEAGELNEH